jgi:hypothetical protein
MSDKLFALLVCVAIAKHSLLTFSQIPFVVIVQPHMLKDKGLVRLRRVLLNGAPDNSNDSEQVVSLDNLAWTIQESSPNSGSGNEDTSNDPAVSSGQAQSNIHREGGRNIEPSVECIYVQNDQFYDNDRPVSKADTSNFKSVIKAMRGITQRAESFLHGMVDRTETVLPVFAVDVDFWCLREFGSRLMKTARNQGYSSVCQEVIDAYPSYKRSLKTLSSAIETYMKRNGFGQGDKPPKREVTLLLYSKVDDRFDMVTL